MALEATHMRFALDVKENYKINNIAEYIQGSIYPDSRYVSGIDRQLTHGDIFLKPEFVTSDFNAGWQVHWACDKIMGRIFKENIPGFVDFFAMENKEDWWVPFTAGKIIADMKDMQSFDIQSALKYLDSGNCPNGENISAIQKYNQIVIDLYKDKIVPTVDDYIIMWSGFGISDDLGIKVGEKTKQFINDGLSDTIWSCYDKMIKSFGIIT